MGDVEALAGWRGGRVRSGAGAGASSRCLYIIVIKRGGERNKKNIPEGSRVETRCRCVSSPFLSFLSSSPSVMLLIHIV